MFKKKNYPSLFRSRGKDGTKYREGRKGRRKDGEDDARKEWRQRIEAR